MTNRLGSGTLTASIGAESIGEDFRKIVNKNWDSGSNGLRDTLVYYRVWVIEDQHPDPQTTIRIGKKLRFLASKRSLCPKFCGHQDRVDAATFRLSLFDLIRVLFV